MLFLRRLLFSSHCYVNYVTIIFQMQTT